jgi:hypothetical protein
MEFLSHTANVSSAKEVVLIPEEITVYRRSYIDSSEKKHKSNKFTRGMQISIPQVEISESVELVGDSVDKEIITITHQTTFALDLTGSMQSIIDSVKNEIVPVTKRLKEEASKAVESLPNDGTQVFVLNFEVAVIGYRDFLDSVHFETHDFTSEISEIEEFLKTLRAMGGDDEPEDVKGAFIHALYGVSDISQKLSWKTDTASKSIFLITDAPAHGLYFHLSGPIGDHFSNDSEDEWQTILSEMKSNQISFNVIKINKKTSKMCEKFRSLCEFAELPYTEIDISQQIEEVARPFGLESKGRARGGSTRAVSTLGGHTEAVLSSIYRMTSTGYATSRASSHTPREETIVVDDMSDK